MATVTKTIAIDLYPIKSRGNVTNGLTTVFNAPNAFKKINFSCALIIFENTLIGNETAKFMVSNNIKIRAVPYSSLVKPSLNTKLRFSVKNNPHASATAPITRNIIRNNPFNLYIDPPSSAFLYFAKYLT